MSGPGAEARNSIGIVLVTGMVVGTLFTLIVVPVFYTLLASRHARAEVENTDEAGARTAAEQPSPA